MNKKPAYFGEFMPTFSSKYAGFLSCTENGVTMPKFTLHFFVTLLKNSTDKISLTKRLYILPLQR